MIMETLSCGYPVGPAGLGSSPMTPPASPPDSHSFNPHECSPQLYSETQYSQTAYTSTPIHHQSNFLPRYVEDDANNNNSIYKSIHDDRLNNNSSSDALLGDLSSLCISEDVIEEEEEDDELSNRFSASDYTPPASELSETDDCASRMSPSRSSAKSSFSSTSSGRSSKSKKNSRSKAKTSTESTDSGFGRSESDNSSRKDSFVYDVRLPDEQFLFFVEDLDLVKSHLMFAVREEVDVLKDRIVELMDRIKHLECENTVLRQYASPEVLQQLQAQLPPHQMQQPPHHPTNS